MLLWGIAVEGAGNDSRAELLPLSCSSVAPVSEVVGAVTPGVDSELPIARLDALSDGVFAIAITLLALKLGVEANADQHPIHAILAEWPSYLAFVTSFLTIGVGGMAHSAITSALRAANATIYRLNLLVLPVRSRFCPFPTKLVAGFGLLQGSRCWR